MSSVPPKRSRVVYKGIEIVIQYQPQDKKWKWSFVITHKTTFSDYCNNEKEAALTAKKELDRYFAMGEKILRRNVP